MTEAMTNDQDDPMFEPWAGYKPILGQLVINPAFQPVPGINDQDWLEACDAAWEDQNGRLPGQPGYKPRRRRR